MNVKLWSSRRPILFVFLAVVLLTAACGAQIGGANWPGLSADSDTLYYANGTHLIALDPDTQQIKWQMAAASSTASLLASPEIGEERVYIGDYGLSQGFLSPGVRASVYAIDKNSSGELTVAEGLSNPLQNPNVATDRIVASPRLADGKLFVGTANDYLMALDADTLEVIWGTDQIRFDHSIWGKPAYADGIVVATSLDTTVRAFDADTGSELWIADTTGAIAASPIIVDGIVLVAGFDAMLHAYDLQSGDELWKVEAANWIWNGPAIINGTAFFGDTNGVVYAVDVATGDLQWQQQQEGLIQASLVTDGSQLIVPLVIGVSTDEQTGKLISLSPEDGSLNWQQDTTLPTFSAPVIIQDNIVIVQTDIASQRAASSLQQFDLQTGSKGWSWTPAE